VLHADTTRQPLR